MLREPGAGRRDLLVGEEPLVLVPGQPEHHLGAQEELEAHAQGHQDGFWGGEGWSQCNASGQAGLTPGGRESRLQGVGQEEQLAPWGSREETWAGNMGRRQWET